MSQNFDAIELSVAKPCHMSWETMSGDERVRLCNVCDMNIYNISEMSSAEITTLIETREGRLCGRIVKRADGTVMTKDCPPGLRGYRKRISRFAGATLATILGLFSLGFSQDTPKCERSEEKVISRIQTKEVKSRISGVVIDVTGLPIPKAKITLIQNDRFNKKQKKLKKKTKSSKKGRFDISDLPVGSYSLVVEAKHFKTKTFVTIKLNSKEDIEMKINLEVGPVTTVVGVFAPEPMLNRKDGSLTYTISGERIKNLPIPK